MVFPRYAALIIVSSWGIACGGSVDFDPTDGDPFGAGVGGWPTPAAVCPAGGPQGPSPEMLGPPPGDTGDLWRGLGEGEGEGESFTMPRPGVIDQVIVQIFAMPGVTACRARVYRKCDGQRVLVATTDKPASAFPVYVIAVQPGTTIWDQDLSTTTIDIDPPVPVAAGEEVEVVFSAVGGVTYSSDLVSVITMADVTPDARAVFPNGAPGIPDYTSLSWDYHAQIRLR